MKQFAEERVVGAAYDPKTELGPVVSDAHKKFVTGWIDKGVEEGADLILDGRDIVVPGFEGGHFVGPTIFDNVTEDMICGREEAFGPVLFIKRVDGLRGGHHDHEQQPATPTARASSPRAATTRASSRAARTPAWSASTSASPCR